MYGKDNFAPVFWAISTTQKGEKGKNKIVYPKKSKKTGKNGGNLQTVVLLLKGTRKTIGELTIGKTGKAKNPYRTGDRKMRTYNMDVEQRSRWLRTTPGAAALAQPYHCTEAGLFYGQQHFATARTDKESYILFYTLQGAGLVEQDGMQVELPAGQALLLDCRTAQSYCTAPGQSCWHHYWAHLDGPGVQAMQDLLNPGRPLPVPVPLDDAKSSFETVLSGIESETAASTVETSLALHQLLAAMVRQQLDGESGSANRTLIEHAADYIRAHYGEDLSLDTLLAEAPISKSYFLRLFRQYMGTTPYNFLLCTRITQAKELLVMSDESIGEIARKTGFGSESNFSARFAAMVGQSPMQYRKRAWNKA
jgi:AraC-like DNA-binding protein